jgi:hypothetical protein
VDDVRPVTPEHDNISPASSTSSTETVRAVGEKSNLEIQDENLDSYYPKEIIEENHYFEKDNISSSFADSFPKPTDPCLDRTSQGIGQQIRDTDKIIKIKHLWILTIDQLHTH